VSIELQFTEEDWARIERDWNAWWAGELDRPLVMIEEQVSTQHEWLPDLVPWEDLLTSSFTLDTPADAVIDYYQCRLEARRFHGDAFPKWWPNFGPGIVAGFLGAQVQCAPDTVWFEPPGQTSINDLHPAYEAENAWWRRVQELTRLAVARWGSQVVVGHTDLGGTLDILASLRTTQHLLYDLVDAPGEVARLSGELTRLWLRYYDELEAAVRPAGRGTSCWAMIWSPGRCYMLQNDLAYMISPQMFERFVLPDLAACCEALEHGFYHLDGKGQIRHLDLLLSMERLRGIQWIPGDGQPPPEEWLPLLKRIRDGGKLCQLYVSPAGALKIVHELGGQGLALYIQETMTAEQAHDFCRAIAREGNSR